MNGQSDYGTMLLNRIEECDRDTAELNYFSAQKKLVDSYGFKLSKDGDKWCCLLGETIQEGVAFFENNPQSAVSKAAMYICTDIEKLKELGVGL